jgi:hypothetical protein
MPMKKRGSGLAYKSKSGTGKSKKKANREIASKGQGGYVRRVAKRLRGATANDNSSSSVAIESPKDTMPTTASVSPDARVTPSVGADCSTQDGNGMRGTSPLSPADSDSSSAIAATRSSTENDSNRSTRVITSNNSPRAITVDAADSNKVTPSMSAYKRRKIESSRDIRIDPNAFSVTKGGKERTSKQAADLARRRGVRSVIEEIMRHGKE